MPERCGASCLRLHNSQVHFVITSRWNQNLMKALWSMFISAYAEFHYIRIFFWFSDLCIPTIRYISCYDFYLHNETAEKFYYNPFCFRIIQNCVFEEAHTTLVTIYHWRSVGTEVDIRKGDNMIAIFDIVGIGFITL